jgi:hypothetical protein
MVAGDYHTKGLALRLRLEDFRHMQQTHCDQLLGARIFMDWLVIHWGPGPCKLQYMSGCLPLIQTAMAWLLLATLAGGCNQVVACHGAGS